MRIVRLVSSRSRLRIERKPSRCKWVSRSVISVLWHADELRSRCRSTVLRLSPFTARPVGLSSEGFLNGMFAGTWPSRAIPQPRPITFRRQEVMGTYRQEMLPYGNSNIGSPHRASQNQAALGSPAGLRGPPFLLLSPRQRLPRRDHLLLEAGGHRFQGQRSSCDR